MISVIAVAVSAFFALAVILASPNRFTDNMKKNPIVIAALLFDLLFIAGNLILYALSLQIIPTVKCITAIILVVVTLFSTVFGVTRRKAAIISVSVFAVLFVMIGAVAIPTNHGVKEFDGEKYIGISFAIEEFVNWKYIYYYKPENPLLISNNYDVVEDYGIVLTSDWDEIKANDPYQIEYYEDGKCVETEYYMFRDPE